MISSPFVKLQRYGRIYNSQVKQNIMSDTENSENVPHEQIEDSELEFEPLFQDQGGECIRQ